MSRASTGTTSRTVTERTRRAVLTRSAGVGRVLAAAASVAVLGLVAVGCSDDGDGDAATPTTTAGVATTTVAPTGVTSDPGVVESLCGRLGPEELAAAGVPGDIGTGQDVTAVRPLDLGAAGGDVDGGRTGITCQYDVTAPGSTFSLFVSAAGPVDSSAYEALLADPDAGDPTTVDGVGEQAGSWTSGSTAVLVAYGSGNVVRVSSYDGASTPVDVLAAVARAVLDV